MELGGTRWNSRFFEKNFVRLNGPKWSKTASNDLREKVSLGKNLLLGVFENNTPPPPPGLHEATLGRFVGGGGFWGSSRGVKKKGMGRRKLGLCSMGVFFKGDQFWAFFVTN